MFASTKIAAAPFERGTRKNHSHNEATPPTASHSTSSGTATPANVTKSMAMPLEASELRYAPPTNRSTAAMTSRTRNRIWVFARSVSLSAAATAGGSVVNELGLRPSRWSGGDESVIGSRGK